MENKGNWSNKWWRKSCPAFARRERDSRHGALNGSPLYKEKKKREINRESEVGGGSVFELISP